MFSVSKAIIRDPWVVTSQFLGLAALAGSIAQTAQTIHPGTGLIFLHLNIISGVNLTGVWWQLYLIPLVGFLVWLIDLFLLVRMYRSDVVASRLLGLTSLIMTLGMWWGVHLLLGVNG
jgi:hypothetical protein